jgi:SpoIID/LytB domain protein
MHQLSWPAPVGWWVVPVASLRLYRRARSRRHGSALVGSAALALFTGAALTLIGTPSPAGAYPSANVVLTGHGYGHGIGMGQWGSLGYAINQPTGVGPMTYQQILAHYYGNSSLQTLGTAPAPPSLNGGNVRVAMTEVNDGDTIVTDQAGDANGVTYTTTAGTATATAVLFHLVSPNNYNVFTSGGCAGQGGWSLATNGTGVNNPTASPTTPGNPMFLCGPNLTLHGTLTALANSSGAARTINTVNLEQYVADVAPSESPSSWGNLGDPGPQGKPWGFQQSEAQTVAARSYAEAAPNSFGGYADTCDQTCQSYPGTRNENLLSIGAAIATSGQVMVINNTSTVATTEYSSSSGGYSAGAQFPAVLDAGDAVCVPGACNTHHTWTVSIPVSTIQATYPQIGTLSSVAITSRNGLGDFGGRVNTMSLSGSSGSVSLSGNAFAAAFNLQSNWFSLGNQPSGGIGGYWLNAADGGVFSFGNAQFYGSTGNIHLNKPVVGMSPTHDAAGYWEVASDGGIFSFGDANFHGSVPGVLQPGQQLNKPIVGMATTPGGGGYWVVASDGGIFSFGDATFHGSTGSIVLNKPIVGMVPTHDGGGYWLIASDGGLFAFGDATYHGSLGASPPPTPIVAVAPTPDGGGYWMLEANGTLHAFGDAPALLTSAQSPGLDLATSPMIGMAPTSTGQGLVVVDTRGQAFSLGDGPYLGDVASSVNGYSGRIVGVAVTPG